jgi:hypothetical protein
VTDPSRRPGVSSAPGPSLGPVSGSVPSVTFSLTDGGPLRHLSHALGLTRAPLGGFGPGVALAAFTWGPLLVLTVVQALGGDGRLLRSFVDSVSSHARLLVAIPLFFAAETWIDPRVRHFVEHLVDSGLVPRADVNRLAATVRIASRLRDSVLVEAGLLALVIAFATAGVRIGQPSATASWQVPGGSLSLAGWWYVAVGLPIYQFLLGRWLWRMVIWWWLLWRLSRLDLRLIPVHPDLAGGLGHLGVVVSHFGVLGLAFSTSLAGGFLEDMRFNAVPLRQFLIPAIELVALTLVICVGPLFFFAPRMFAVKRQGLREYGRLGTAYARQFLADLGNSFSVIRQMRIIPIGPGLVLPLIVATLVPMLPLLLVAFSVDDLLLRLLGLLFGV